MALVEAEAQDEELVEAPRRKTPLLLLGAGAVVLAGVVVWGLKSSMTVEAPITDGHTQRAADAEGSSMVRLLEEQRQEAQEREQQAAASASAGAAAAQTPTGAAPNSAAAPVVAPPGAETYVPPTGSVPRYPFAGGSNCEELATLQERLACLDSQFVFETRRSRLKEVGDSMTSDDNLFMWDGGEATKERRDDSVRLPASPAWGSLAGFGDDGASPGGARGEEAPSRDSSLEFHRTGGSAHNPQRSVSDVKAPTTRYWLRSGSILPCAFISGVTSQLPGQVEAQITQNVYDSIDHRHLLIPAGSMLVGRPNPDTRQGQSRIQFAWTELHLPDGEFRELGGMAGADGAGLAGVEGTVNRHWGRKLGLALMTSTVNVAFHMATPPPGTGTMQDAVAQGVGEGVVQVASENLRKMMEIPDEIVIRPGQTCSVKVEQSMAFPRAYEDGKRWRR